LHLNEMALAQVGDLNSGVETGARKRIQKTILIAAGVALCLFVIGLAIVILKWPFTQTGSVDRLQRLLGATVEIKSFRPTYFPYAGYVAEGVTFRRQLSPGAPEQPFITVERLTVQSSYLGLFRKPHILHLVLAEGLHAEIPGSGMNLTSHKSGKPDSVVAEEFRVENSELAITSAERGHKPLAFTIHSARFLNLGTDRTIAFSSTLRIPEPPGEAETHGWLGPFATGGGSMRRTPVNGSYVLRGADLGHYKSLMGILSSQGEFSGTLADLRVNGSTTSPDFGVRESRHHFRLATRFAGSVDLKSGDVVIQSLQADLGKTTLSGTARIAGKPKAIELDVAHGQGQVEDLVLLFSDAPRSAIAGPISFSTKAALSTGNGPFKKRVRLTGEFNIDPAHFTSEHTQHSVDKLSAEAQGEHSELAEDNEAVSKLQGHVVLGSGIARFSQITFRVPGAAASMAGTYSLLNKRVKFDGKMRMEAKLSQATTGAKSVFLKLLDPFYKKKNAGAELPVQMDGVYGHTHFSIGLRAKK
jgi:hypothetical protein